MEKQKIDPFQKINSNKNITDTKINHLILALLNPSEEVIKSFQNDLYNKKCITALKSTWIRHILQSNAKWKKLLESELKICIDKL